MAQKKWSEFAAGSALTGTEIIPGIAAGVNRRWTAAQIATYITALITDSAPATLDTLNELAAALGDDPNFAATMAAALAGKQPLDADLTAIAAVTTTPFGRGMLTMADSAAALTALSGQPLASTLTKLAALTLAPEKVIRINASGDAELIDWILSGSWTPTITCVTPGDLSVSYSTQVGGYNKRGKMVEIWGTLIFTPTYSTATGNLRIDGLPAAADSSSALATINFASLSSFTWPSSSTQLFMTPQTSAQYAHIVGHRSGGSTATAQMSMLPSGTAQTLRFSGTYRSAA